MRTNTRIHFLAAAIALLGTNTLLAADSASSFLGDAVEDSRAEVQVSQLALQKSQRQDVKEFAQRMVKDHSALIQRIESLAREKHVKLPDGTTLVQKASYEKLAHTDGDFDKDYMDHNVSDHQDDIKKFGEQANSGKDAEVKALAAETLPKLQEHLKLAKALDAKIAQH
jgi:putative membrane protein